jgi:uncharacterized protein YceK
MNKFTALLIAATISVSGCAIPISHQAQAQASKPGVRIGMTADQVRNETFWGAPLTVHVISTAKGSSEQWVYPHGYYLYFTNGILTSGQN